MIIVGDTRALSDARLFHAPRLQAEKMSSLGLFFGRSDRSIEGCFGIFGAALARSWYIADAPPSHFDFGAQFEWLSLLLSDQNRVRTAWLHATYYQYRSQITDDKSALATFEQHHYIWQCSVTPINRLPAEIMTEIFRIALDIGHVRGGLALVCRHWWEIIEGMPSAWTSLDMGAASTPESVQHLLNRAGRHPLTVKIDFDKVEGMAERLQSYLAIAGNKASQWDTLTICSLPRHEQSAQSDHARLSVQLQPMRQIRHLIIKEPVLSPLLRLLLQNVATAAVGNLMSMELHSFSAVHYLLQPERASICSSLTTFIAKVPKMDQPVDILPHFMQLEVLDLTNLLLPITDNDSPLPLAHTLHRLHIKSVSIQWMGGHVFSQLEKCTIIAPLTDHSLHHDVQLPACINLHFENWDISPFGQFFAPALDHLRVKSNVWSPYTGNGQIVQLVRAGFGMSFQPKSLSLSVICKEKVLLAVLQLLPGLVELRLDLPRPSALGKYFFTGLLAKPVKRVTDRSKFDWRELFRENITGWRCTVCPSLRILELKYQQWLRPGYNNGFLPPLLSLSWSRGKISTPLQLEVHYKSSVHSWDPTLQHVIEVISHLKIPQHSQVTHLCLQTDIWKSAPYENALLRPFLHHLQVFEIGRGFASERRVVDVLPFFHELRELKLSYVDVPPIVRGVDLPLLYTLRKLALWDSTLSWMDGLVFTQLKRFEVDEHGWPEAFKEQVGMPACTHVVFRQDKLRTLPILQSNFQFPLPLDTLELSSGWKFVLYDDDGIGVLQRIRAKRFKIYISDNVRRLLESLGSNDGLEQLELILPAHPFSFSGVPPVTVAQRVLTELSVLGSTTGRPLCVNMKALRLRFRDLEGAARRQISESCRQMMDNRRLAGYPLEKCCIGGMGATGRTLVN